MTIGPLDLFRARAEARATLWAAGELGFIEAIDTLQTDAIASGLVAEFSQDEVQKILSDEFAKARRRCWMVIETDQPPRARLAASTITTIEWLLSKRDPDQLRP